MLLFIHNSYLSFTELILNSYLDGTDVILSIRLYMTLKSLIGYWFTVYRCHKHDNMRSFATSACSRYPVTHLWSVLTWLETFHNNKGRCAGHSKVFNNPPGGRAVNITVESIGSRRTNLHLKVGAQSEKILSWPRYESATFDPGAIGSATELRMSAQILISFFFGLLLLHFFFSMRLNIKKQDLENK